MDIIRNVVASGERSVTLVTRCGLPVHFTAWVNSDGNAMGRYDLSPSSEMKVRMGLYESTGLPAKSLDYGYLYYRGKDRLLTGLFDSFLFRDEARPSLMAGNPLCLSSDLQDEYREWVVPVMEKASNFVDFSRLEALQYGASASRDDRQWLSSTSVDTILVMVYNSSPDHFLHWRGNGLGEVRADQKRVYQLKSSHLLDSGKAVSYLRSKLGLDGLSKGWGVSPWIY